jgi:hypothetical protein
MPLYLIFKVAVYASMLVTSLFSSIIVADASTIKLLFVIVLSENDAK